MPDAEEVSKHEFHAAAVCRFFIDAMRNGWVGDGKIEEREVFPGVTMSTFTHANGMYKLVDMWVSNGNRSAGWTVISYYGEPVWSMSYEGWYEEAAIPIVKAALKRCYDGGIFRGGRGPHNHSDAGLLYVNETSRDETFASFEGCEEVFDVMREDKLGEHTYRGGLLV